MTSIAQPVTSAPGFGSRLFLSGALAFFVAGTLPALYGVALPIWSERFGLGEGEGGLLLSANGAGAFLAVLSGVFGIPGLGSRTGLLALGLGAMLLSVAGTWGLTLAAAVVTGFGFGLLTTSVNRRFLAGFGERGPGMVGLVNAVYGLGAILSPLAFLLAGGRPGAVFLGTTALALFALTLAEPDEAPAARGLPDLSQRRLLVTLFIFANGLVEGISIGFGASALIGVGLSAQAAAQLTSGFFVAYLLSRVSLYWLAHRIPSDRLFVIGAGGAGLAMAVAVLGAPAVGYVVAGAFIGLIFPAYYVWAIGILGEDARMTAAILTMALLGSTLGPIVLRPILAVTGEEGVFWIVSAAGLMLATCFAALKGRARALAPASA
ncbi:hypothetical protein FHG66_14390 [Rubellimicrobium rubrum]|uniref:MFS transporter n=1 Tax=Rubellimicrobium rubrum TaxID=2585369 RepID=A0A5C4MRB5_9RHOB|nr:hypothetical protein [Rubellimicrobium rubrum]TNC48307.1 hypothetical protein FHG66_14390 [Rubellimicrobium rubrum]